MQLELCRSCFGEVERRGNYYVCLYCGTKWLIDAAEDVHAVDRANAWAALRDCDFEKSAEAFENIILKEPQNHEAYWGRALARAGIIYVVDLNESKRVPTCNNISEESFLTSPDVKKAISLAPREIAASYTEQAEKIERIRVEWIEKARREPAYDVFISYKDSDREHGIERTQDSVDAQDLYNALTDEGFKVFFSRLSLKNKVAEQYEPYIYNAIKTAKVMVVFGEKPEYFSAVWIKNEWTRFRARIEKGEKHKNSLVVAYRNMSPADLPVALKTRQCLNAADITFLPDLVRHIKRVIEDTSGKEHLERVKIAGGQVSKKASKIANDVMATREIGNGEAEVDISEKQQLDLVKSFISNKEWNDADMLLENMLFSNPSNAEALWFKIFVNHKTAVSGQFLKDLNESDIPNIEKVLSCANKSFASQVLDVLYYSCKINSGEVFNKLLETILPFNYEGRSRKIKELFEESIQKERYETFRLLLSALDESDVDAYIEYNLRFAGVTRKKECAETCVDAVLAVEEGNVEALRKKFRLVCGSAPNEEIIAVFETILKYCSDPDGEVISFLNELCNQLARKENCELVRQVLKYYSGDLVAIKTTLLTLSYEMIAHGYFEDARYLCGIILSFDVNCAEVYWDICLIKMGAKNTKDVVNSKVNVKTIPEYVKYLTLVDEKRRQECMALARRQEARRAGRKRAKRARIVWSVILAAALALILTFTVVLPEVERINRYNSALELMEQGRYAEAIDVFIALDSYKESDERIIECNTAIKDIAYEDAIALMNAGKYNEAIEAFKALGGHKDSKDKITACVTAIKDIAYEDAVALMNAGKYNEAIEAFKTLDGHKDSKDKITACETAIKDIKYEDAVVLMSEGKYSEALAAFKALDGHKDSANKIAECEAEIKAIDYENAVALMTNGDYAGAAAIFATITDNADAAAYLAKCNHYLEFTYELNDNKDGYVITKYSEADNEVEIPSLYLGLPVVAIGDYAFDQCWELTSVSIPNTVKSIGVCAFRECGATEINIPESVTHIEKYAFLSSGIKSATVPAAIERLGEGVFESCRGLESVTFHDNFKSVGQNAFKNCASLKIVTLPDSVTSIGASAFEGCAALESITVPFIGADIDGTENTHFGYIFGSNAKAPSSLVTVVVTGGTRVDKNAFYSCTHIQSLTLPDSVTSIGDSAFYNCSKLKDITIPDSVTTIAKGAFQDCALESITLPFLGGSKTSTENTYFGYIFGGDEYLDNYLSVPETLKTVVITGSTSIDYCAFYGCSYITSITLPEGIKILDNGAFRGCTRLENINIPDGVTSIGGSTFKKCSSLKSIVVPQSVESIGVSAFEGCSSLESITIPDSVTSIDNYAFYGCSSLTSITIPDSVTSIGNYAFRNCKSLTSITIPDSVTSIGEGAFSYCSSLKTVYYTGTEKEWADISIGSDNDYLTIATIVYNYVPEE